MNEITQQEQDEAIKTLSNLVKENQELKGELNLARQFAIRLLMAKEVHKSENSVYFFDDGVIQYQEDFDKILNKFFIDFRPNSNCNPVDGIYMSSVSARIKNGTPWPATGSADEIKETIMQADALIAALNKEVSNG